MQVRTKGTISPPDISGKVSKIVDIPVLNKSKMMKQLIKNNLGIIIVLICFVVLPIWGLYSQYSDPLFDSPWKNISRQQVISIIAFVASLLFSFLFWITINYYDILSFFTENPAIDIKNSGTIRYLTNPFLYINENVLWGIMTECIFSALVITFLVVHNYKVILDVFMQNSNYTIIGLIGAISFQFLCSRFIFGIAAIPIGMILGILIRTVFGVGNLILLFLKRSLGEI